MGIEGSADPSPTVRWPRIKLVGLILIAVSICVGVAGVVTDNNSSGWALLGFSAVIALTQLASPPTFAVFERHLRAVQITAGALMLVSAAIVLIAYNDAPVRVTAGVLIALAGSAMLVPALFPALRRKYPRVFGAPYLAQKPPP